MHSIKIETIIPESHHLELDIPAEIPSGSAEIIVMPISPSNRKSAISEGLAWLALSSLRKSRSPSDIDLSIKAERNSWE